MRALLTIILHKLSLGVEPMILAMALWAPPGRDGR
jgi:hypothetical protein